MPAFTDVVDALETTVSSPDGRLTARVFARRKAELSMPRYAYRRYDRVDLERQLGQLAKLAFVAYRRARREALERELGEPVGDADTWDVAKTRYREELRNLNLDAESEGGWVRVRSRGLIDWRFELAPDTLDAIDREEFLTEVNGAVAAVIARQREKRMDLVMRYGV